LSKYLDHELPPVTEISSKTAKKVSTLPITVPSDLFGLRVKLLPVTTSLNHSKVEAIRLSALLKDTTSELAGLSPH